MSTTRKKRRRPRGRPWYWAQTNSWYFTPPGTKRRVGLKDENGRPIRGLQQREIAELALARIKVASQWRPTPEPTPKDTYLVAKACSDYVEYCRRGVERSEISRGHFEDAVRYLNDFCNYCGALPIDQLKKGHVLHWVESHTTWRSSAARRNAMIIVHAALNRAQEQYAVVNPLVGLKKPLAQPSLSSFSPDEEALIYGAADAAFRDFLFAAIHTGLRPFCELARLTADHVVEAKQGMMWKVFSSKTRRTRTIPVRSEVADLTRRLTKSAPKGSGVPLLRNPRGGAWKKVTGVARFLGIKRKLGWRDDSRRAGFSCYTCRHTFAHRMLSGFWNEGAGCSIETLAELMGNTPAVAYSHYGREWGTSYQDPLWSAIESSLPRPRQS